MSVQVSNVSKYYGSQLAVNDVSFQIKAGEIVGLIGPNGAGKTTLMRMMCGLLSTDSGKIELNSIAVEHDLVTIKKLYGYLPENNPLYPDMFIREYLEFSLGLYIKNRNKKKRMDEVIEMTGLGPEIHKSIGQLSKGYRQRVGLARALIHDPQILILDEPTTGLDPNQIIEIRNLISTIGKEKTVILSTHIMQEVEAICNRVIIINKGSIVADDLPSNLKIKLGKNSQSIVVEFDKNIDEQILRSIDGVDKVQKIAENSWLIESWLNEDIRHKIFKTAVKNDLTVLSMQLKNTNLEEIFHDLTSGKNT